jgi:Fe-S-cluster containining protein
VVRGITLFPEEVAQFPAEFVLPLYRSGEEVFAYQLGSHICPMLTEDGRCGIYDNRPLICKAFPVGYMEQRGLVILVDRCPRTWDHKEEDFDYQSFAGCYEAAHERERRELAWPAATAAFSLKTKDWMEL